MAVGAVVMATAVEDAMPPRPKQIRILRVCPHVYVYNRSTKSSPSRFWIMDCEEGSPGTLWESGCVGGRSALCHSDRCSLSLIEPGFLPMLFQPVSPHGLSSVQHFGTRLFSEVAFGGEAPHRLSCFVVKCLGSPPFKRNQGGDILDFFFNLIFGQWRRNPQSFFSLFCSHQVLSPFPS